MIYLRSTFAFCAQFSVILKCGKIEKGRKIKEYRQRKRYSGYTSLWVAIADFCLLIRLFIIVYIIIMVMFVVLERDVGVGGFLPFCYITLISEVIDGGTIKRSHKVVLAFGIALVSVVSGRLLPPFWPKPQTRLAVFFSV